MTAQSAVSVKIFGICSSARKGGNSDILLNAFIQGARSAGRASIKKAYLSDLEIKFSEEKDDDMRIIYKEIEKADVIAIAAPIYFGNLPARLKLVVDRFQPYWVKKEIFKKPPLSKKRRAGVFLCVSAADRNDFLKNSSSILKNLFAVLGIKYSGEVYCAGVDGKGDIRSKTACMEKARKLGEKLIKSFL